MEKPNDGIEKILQDLFDFDPSLRQKEAEMRKIIRDLLADRPDTGFDEAFQDQLKNRLLEAFSEQHPKRKPFRPFYWGLAASLFFGAVALTLWLRQETPNQAPQKIETISRDIKLMVPPIAAAPSDSRMKGAAKKSEDLDERLVAPREVSDGFQKQVEQSLDSLETTSLAEAGAEKEYNREEYAIIHENEFLSARDNPLSTFSIDVDTAAYANVRRHLQQNTLPPRDAVRIEELINYFDYDHEAPRGEKPFALIGDIAQTPWNPDHKLVMVAIKGMEIQTSRLPASNLVFLIDVSGSMDEPQKLPLLKESFRLLVGQLDKRDRVSIVVYAGAAGVVLPPTRASEKETILSALDRLKAGGSTAGGEGIDLAYHLAEKNLVKGGNNRVILATDGDFNIGPFSDADMEHLIESKRDKGIFLSVLGFGMGNYKDAKMEILADRGNGNYAYIDSILEAKKVLVNDLRKTLFTIAKDVKIQVEFNPAHVGSYRLIGYENRLLKKEDFRDDRKDAGEIGSGHSVTAFYEIIPPELSNKSPDSLKYQKNQIRAEALTSRELLTLRVRYKDPDGEVGKEISEVFLDENRPFEQASRSMRFAASVAEFGLLLRDSRYKGRASFDRVLAEARRSLGPDPHGYGQEFLRLVETAQLLSRNRG
jgi:Ca-activated chloride channel family protein